MDVSNVTANYSAQATPVVSAPVQTAPEITPAAPVEAPVSQPSKQAVPTGLDAAIERIDKKSGAVPNDSLDKAIDKINQSLVTFNRQMRVSMHSKLNRIMVKVIDTEQNKVIREIPPEKILDAFAKALEMAGVLVDEKR